VSEQRRKEIDLRVTVEGTIKVPVHMSNDELRDYIEGEIALIQATGRVISQHTYEVDYRETRMPEKQPNELTCEDCYVFAVQVPPTAEERADYGEDDQDSKLIIYECPSCHERWSM
jgi:hypothetical protein